jgi:hypothetical protein
MGKPLNFEWIFRTPKTSQSLSSKAGTWSRNRMVPGAGIEPARPCGHEILSLGRLPIPPSRHNVLIRGGIGGDDRSRTDLKGFADLCLTAWLRRLIWEVSYGSETMVSSPPAALDIPNVHRCVFSFNLSSCCGRVKGKTPSTGVDCRWKPR